MSETEIISVSEFKAKCLDILARLDARQLDRVELTKRGRTVAVLTPPETKHEAVRKLHGFMKGTVIGSDDFDLAKPICEDEFLADTGELHF